jgi:hypothetical protein
MPAFGAHMSVPEPQHKRAEVMYKLLPWRLQTCLRPSKDEVIARFEQSLVYLGFPALGAVLILKWAQHLSSLPHCPHGENQQAPQLKSTAYITVGERFKRIGEPDAEEWKGCASVCCTVHEYKVQQGNWGMKKGRRDEPRKWGDKKERKEPMSWTKSILHCNFVS